MEKPGEVICHYTVPEKFQGYPGVVQGGIVATMLDEITLRAHMPPDAPRFMFTARLDVRYRKPVPIGQPLRIVGQAVKDHNRAATSKGFIYGPDGTLLAEAEALLIDVPEGMRDAIDLDKLGWKVYGDGPEETV